MVVHDCSVGGVYKNPLHGFTTMLYADWKIAPTLELRPALEVCLFSFFEINFISTAIQIILLSKLKYLEEVRKSIFPFVYIFK